VICVPTEHAAKMAALARRSAQDAATAAGELARGLGFSQATAKFSRI